MISILLILSLNVNDLARWVGTGGSRLKKMMMKATKPIAVFRQLCCYHLHSNCSLRKLIQKQNLHVSFGVSVKIPPSRGPNAEATPYMLVTTETYKCLLLTGTAWAMSVNVPHHKPPPAAPETTLPTMNTIELGADALKVEPISKPTIEIR